MFVLMVSCNRKPVELVEETYPGGQAKTVRYYKDDSREVLVKEILFYEDGTKKMEGAFKEGERAGLWSYWYSNGNLWSQGVYSKGIENGQKTVWHENGQKYYEGVLKDGKRSGVWKFWDPKGNLMKEIDYDKQE
jgi:antitoxin component YwqK of YwqJK toxin-antitoxin module